MIGEDNMALFSRTIQGKYQLFVFMFMLAAILFLEGQIQVLENSNQRINHDAELRHLDAIDDTIEPHNGILDHRSTLPLSEDVIVVYNRVPKTGSTSFVGVAYTLCEKNDFHVLHINTTRNANVMSLADQARFVRNVTYWDSVKPALYHGHIAYLEFNKFDVVRKPLYINIIRKPLERLISYYYFLRYGDDLRPHLVRRRHGDTMTFDECVANNELQCSPEKLWMQIPYFCGHEAECWNRGSKWALEQAKRNLVSNYFLVGVTEEMEDFIAVLEVVLPRFFKGAVAQFKSGGKSHLRRTNKKELPSPETTAKFEKSEIWKMEEEFYHFALEHFHYIKKRILNHPTSQQFFFEKIRP